MAKKTTKKAQRKKPPTAVSKTVVKKAQVKKVQTKKTPEKVAHNNPRKLKRIRRIPNSFKLTKTAYLCIKKDPQLFLGIVAIYGILNLILVKGLSSTTDVGSLKDTLSSLFKGQFGGLASGVGVFVILVGSAGSGGTQDAGAYQLVLAIVFSLAIIWALRQVSAGKKVRIRDAFYQGMYPFVPFILVLAYIFFQLLPVLIGTWIYSNAISSGVAINAGEQIIFILILVLLVGWSFYLVSSSIIALYISTLPDMTPLKAIRSAKALVKKRRLMIFRKLIFLPFFLIIAGGIIMLPIILILTGVAQWVFFILTMCVILAANSFFYTIYRELLNE